ncbi:MAG: ATP-binding protein [Desulfobulbaceae bacterium]|nr:ATP-binding protein [Desulfobulbaceae bacterium]
MSDYIFGANILENLTTGMYQDSKVIYREYIQNACDQIDKAINDGVLRQGEGNIDIQLERGPRTIVIEDNATGIPVASFQQTLGNIADSDKKIGEDKGFRGIGRLCGLAYCEKLVFKSSVKGEKTVSVMVCDAKKMRELIDENNRGTKYTANQVLHAINRFTQEKTSDIDSHFFRVELIDINIENTDLLDFQQVKDYLSFVAPVPYQNSFYYRTEVYKHAQEIEVKIDEYNIKLNGETIFKKYATKLKDSSSSATYDEITGVHFQDFLNQNGELIAWMWVGVSRFQNAIPKINQMRGLRLRKENIQIGGEDALQKLFKEDRGNSYFIGEVFAVDKYLIPNSQRDYFNENPARASFERELKRYFNEELYKTYRDGSAINSSLKKIDKYEKTKAGFNEKVAAGDFVDKEHRDRELNVILELKKEAECARGKIEKIKDKAVGLSQKVVQRIEVDRHKPEIRDKNQPVVPPENNEGEAENFKMPRRTDRLSQYSKAERKLISKIFSIINKSTDSNTAELIIRRIEEGLQ